MRYRATLLALGLTCFTVGLLGVADRLQAQGRVFPTQGVFCNDKTQAIAFLGLWDGHNSADTVKAINAKYGDSSCLLSRAAVSEDETYETVTTTTGTWLLVKVTIVAIGVEGSWMRIPPMEQYTSRKLEPPPGEDA